MNRLKWRQTAYIRGQSTPAAVSKQVAWSKQATVCYWQASRRRTPKLGCRGMIRDTKEYYRITSLELKSKIEGFGPRSFLLFTFGSSAEQEQENADADPILNFRVQRFHQRFLSKRTNATREKWGKSRGGDGYGYFLQRQIRCFLSEFLMQKFS